ncbi:MAG: ATP-binding protein [Caldimicrobium sp.]
MLETFHLRITRKFLLYLNLILLFLLLLPILLLFKYLEHIFLLQAKKQALTVYQQIVITRKWIADHGGIYVEKLPWIEENPYLKLVDKTTKLIASNGKILIKNNPALVTRQLSELAKKNNLYWFKITSEKYLNPYNQPDATEKMALLFFKEKKNLQEFGKIEKINKHYYYRLIKPLIAEQSCLICHAAQGYKEGDVRGALSIFIPLDDTFTQIGYYKKLFLGAFILFWLSLNFTVIFITNRFIFKPLYCILRLLNTLRNLYSKKPSSAILKQKFSQEWQVILESINFFLKEINTYQEQIEDKIRETTKELQTKNELLQNLLEKRKFLITNMAHEIKTPLTCIKGSIEYLAHYLNQQKDILEALNYQKIQEFIEISRNNLKRLIQLIHILIDLEKYEANLLDLDLSTFDLTELIKETAKNLKGLALEKNLSFEINIKDNLWITADREKITIILTNLLHNAIKYSPTGGKIKITVKEKDEWIRIDVEDEGKGISSDNIKLIFEKFYKDNSTGSGLGLTIAKAYVEAHGGKISAIPKERGGHFYIEIPKNLDILK